MRKVIAARTLLPTPVLICLEVKVKDLSVGKSEHVAVIELRGETVPVCARESVVRNTRGQTMTEYALILAAVAVVVHGTYRVLGIAR
jgi:hypothetical protein